LSARYGASLRQVRTLPPRSYVEIFASVVIGALVIACIFHAVVALSGYGFPWDTFLFNPADRYNDWLNSVAAAATLDPYYAPRKAVSAYFPFAYVVFLIGAGLSWAASSAVFLAVSCGLLAGAVAFAWSRERPKDPASGHRDAGELALLLLACLLSYPVLFALDRGNLDVWIGSMCVFYVAALGTRYEGFGFAALSVAIALKGYPAAFLALAVAKGRYRSSIFCAMGAVVLTVLALAGMKGGVVHNVHGWLANLGDYRRFYVLGPRSLFATSDPYNGIRSLVWIVPDAWKVFLPAGASMPSVQELSAPILRAYSVSSLAFALCGAIFVLAAPARHWQRVMAICLVALLFPNVANDYKLCILLPGVLALVLEQDQSRRGWIALLLTCLLMIPKSYFFFIGGRIGVTNLINPVLLIALAACVMVDRDAWRGVAIKLRLRAAGAAESARSGGKTA
jgi:hypothetical protein